MKIQSLAVIFAIIILPIIIIISYYIHSEIDTISNQTAYDTKLIDATYDAMSAFEINTANEELSSVSDALRSIIEASNNTFFNTLATNLGMSNASKSYIRPYIPAILYTLYDGYYIYSPTRVPEVLSDEKGNVIYIGDSGVKNAGEIVENGKKIGKYSYQKTDTSSVAYSTLVNSYEYRQMLFKNKDGTYSPTLNSQTKYKEDYILKSYMPYSARYVEKPDDIEHSSYDLTINYTLDNYITIIGRIKDVYYSKTGYLIGNEVVKEARADGINLLEYNELDAEKICLSGEHNLTLKITPYLENGNYSQEIEYTYSPSIDIPYEGSMTLSYEDQTKKLKKCYESIENKYEKYRLGETSALNEIKEENEKVQVLEANLQNLSAISYYVKAQIFSNWVYDNLGNDGLKIKEKNIKDDLSLNNIGYTTELSKDLSDSIKPFYHEFSDSNVIIFNKAQNPENIESSFSSHKYNIMRNSIQYNLNLALSCYNEMAEGMDIKMPVISDNEWDKILNNVSIVSFMQGLSCGLKKYNNYAIVTSTNNELTVIPKQIYYAKKVEYNTGEDNAIYHRIDCPELKISDGDELISFQSKEINYDKIYDKNLKKYKYDHKNFACYNCIINSNYLKRINPISETNIVNGYNNDILLSTLELNKLSAYYKAVASARQQIYKMNALSDSNGYEILFTSSSDTSNPIDWSNIVSNSSRAINEIKEIEITLRDVKCSNPDVSMITLNAKLNNSIDLSNEKIYLKEQDLTQTITIPVHSNDTSKLNKITLEQDSDFGDVSAYLLNVRVIYE